jgi:hypothetical protein
MSRAIKPGSISGNQLACASIVRQFVSASTVSAVTVAFWRFNSARIAFANLA